jgi:hypothetical protein
VVVIGVTIALMLLMAVGWVETLVSKADASPPSTPADDSRPRAQ